MGWSSGHEVFGTAATALIEAKADGYMKRLVLGALIDALQQCDWDTEDESLREFANEPVIVALFAERGIHLPDDYEPPRPEPITLTVGGKHLVNLHCPEHGFLGVDTFDQTMANLNNHLTTHPDDERREILIRLKETT